ncbi:MAG: T9SS type A sorting domain-containing protein [Ignavibacteria bacterium]|nr:T9SS type A sorting domain-containing protein [Ignavibacteria bacterium]
MKKFYITLLLLTSILLLRIDVTNAGDRMMLIEAFTSSTCPPCATNNPILEAFLSSSDPERISGISYHMNWPSPGNDPMYLYNPTENTARRNYYGVNSIPQARFDGIIHISSGYSQAIFQSHYNTRKDILSPVTIILSDSTYGDSVLVRAVVYCETLISNPSVRVHLVVIEKHIHYATPPGTNGETDFYNVMRNMLPTANGTMVTLYPGMTKVIEERYWMDPIWQANQIEVVAFVQAANNEILNTAKKTLNFTLLSNPAYQVVNQGQSGSKDYQIIIPHIASGYNLPVTFTAAIDPPTTGISASFIGGNVINSFPDSVNLQVTSTAAVPSGEYKVVVTGTNGQGKTHKTVVNYLVGKSYVMVGTNKSMLNFKVNSVNYGSTQIFAWNLGSNQTLEAITPQIFQTTRYVFDNWSNSGDTIQTITVNADTNEYIANYHTQYKITSSVNPSGLPVTVTGGNQFHDSAATVNISVTPTQVQHNNMTYYFQRWLGSGNGSYSGYNSSFQVDLHNPIIQIAFYDTTVGIQNIGTEIPDKYELHQNYPNPFNPVTNIQFDLPKSGQVKLSIYNILGEEIETLYNGLLSAGSYEYDFNASSYASGVYFYRIETGDFVAVKKLVVMK